MSRVFRNLMLLSLLLLVIAPAMAAEGRTPVFLDGTVITADGNYIFTRNIFGGGGTPVVTIAAPNVDLDLNGFTASTPPGSAPVIEITGPPEEVRVHNGKLLGGSAGILRPPAGPGKTVIVENIRFKDATGPTIHLTEVENVRILRNHIVDVGADAILIDPPGFFTHGAIEHNHIRRASGGGITILTSSSLGVLHNRIEQVIVHGIRIEGTVGCLVSENTISDVFLPGGEGIITNSANGCKFYNNVVRHADSHGILIDAASGNNLLLSNVVTDCGFALPGGNGLLVEGFQNHIDRNVLNANSGFGIIFSPVSVANIFGRNMARGNAGGFPAACAAGFFPPDSCNDGGANDTLGDNMIPGPPPF